MKIIPTYEELLDNLNLEKEEQKKLIEILLIIGSIIVALKLPDSMIWIFMLFALAAILYFITINKEKGSNRYLPFAVSGTFTLIVTTILVINLNIPIYLKVIVFVIYYVIFTLIICVALIRR